MALTRRQTEIANLIVKGYSNKQIAKELCVREGTVREHIYQAMRKLNVQNRVMLAVYIVTARQDMYEAITCA